MNLRFSISIFLLLFLPIPVVAQSSGALPEDSASLEDVREVSFLVMSGAKIPDSVWLETTGVTIFDQGQNCDCTYCACAHALSIFQIEYQKRCRVEGPRNNFSYAFLRNLHNKGKACCTRKSKNNVVCCEARISDVLRIINSKGIVPAEQFPNSLKCAEWNAKDTTGAWRYQIDTFSQLKKYSNPQQDIAQLKGAMAKGNPVIVGIYAPESFKRVPSGKIRWARPNIKESVFYHVVVLTGYNRDYFRVLNSYGTRWGNRGSVLVPVEDFAGMYIIGFIIDWTCPGP